MSGWRGMFAGMLALVALEAVVSRTEAAGRVGSALAGLAGMVEHLLSPDEPLVPDLRERRRARSQRDASVTQLRPSSSGDSWLTDVQPHRPRTPRPANG